MNADFRQWAVIPDTRIVAEAEDLARQACEPYLFNHVMRSWLFGAMLAKFAGARADPELLAVAAVLHDLGLTAAHASEADRFEVDGANAARSFLEAHDIAPADVQLVWDAIALHSTRSIALHKGPVVAFCHKGVQVDISGLELQSIDAAGRELVLRAFPRLSLKTRLTECLCGIVRAKPATTYDNFMRDFGQRYVPRYHAISSVDRLDGAPFDDCLHDGPLPSARDHRAPRPWATSISGSS